MCILQYVLKKKGKSRFKYKVWSGSYWRRKKFSFNLKSVWLQQSSSEIKLPKVTVKVKKNHKNPLLPPFLIWIASTEACKSVQNWTTKKDNVYQISDKIIQKNFFIAFSKYNKNGSFVQCVLKNAVCHIFWHHLAARFSIITAQDNILHQLSLLRQNLWEIYDLC